LYFFSFTSLEANRHSVWQDVPNLFLISSGRKEKFIQFQSNRWLAALTIELSVPLSPLAFPLTTSVFFAPLPLSPPLSTTVDDDFVGFGGNWADDVLAVVVAVDDEVVFLLLLSFELPMIVVELLFSVSGAFWSTIANPLGDGDSSAP
jgi:hypothetical protein